MHGGDSQMQHYGCKYVLSKAMVKALPRVVLTLVVAPDLVDSMEDVHAHGRTRLELRTSP